MAPPISSNLLFMNQKREGKQACRANQTSNMMLFHIDSNQTRVLFLTLRFRHLMCITSLINMRSVLLFYFFSLPLMITLTTMHCSTHWSNTHQEASPNPAGVLSRHQNWRGTFLKPTVINPMIFERGRGGRKPFYWRELGRV